MERSIHKLKLGASLALGIPFGSATFGYLSYKLGLAKMTTSSIPETEMIAGVHVNHLAEHAIEFAVPSVLGVFVMYILAGMVQRKIEKVAEMD